MGFSFNNPDEFPDHAHEVDVPEDEIKPRTSVPEDFTETLETAVEEIRPDTDRTDVGSTNDEEE